MIPYGRQDINQSDIDSVINVLQSDFLTQGPKVPLFEKKVSDYCGARYSVAANSATSALHVSCLALGLKRGDRLWTSPNTFVASANCALYCGAKVDFIDVDPLTYNLSVESLEEKLIQARKNNTLPKIVIPVHFAGQSCDMKSIYSLSKEYGFKIIEDASHAIGGKYLDRPIGDCRYSDITIFSFHPVKIITTAEGGLAVTNNKVLLDKMRLFASHGLTRDPELMTKFPEGSWYYQQIELGFNFRMTDIQAALGISQMDRLDNFVAARHKCLNRYDRLLSDLPVVLPYQDPDSYSAIHLYPIQIKTEKIKNDRSGVFDALRSKGIGVQVHYIPVHLHPYYQSMGFKKGDFPNAELYYSRAISLPLFSVMTIEQQDQVCNSLKEVLQ